MLSHSRFAYFAVRYSVDGRTLVAGASDGCVYMFTDHEPKFQLVSFSRTCSSHKSYHLITSESATPLTHRTMRNRFTFSQFVTD